MVRRGYVAFALTNFCSDITAIRAEVQEGERELGLILSLEYFPYSSPDPASTAELKDLVVYSVAGNVANPHHTSWGSTDTNMRGEELLVYLASNDLSILERGAKPTFFTRNKRVVLDLTICSNCSRRYITNWYV